MKHLRRLARHLLANAGQCGVCGGWFDNWPGGTCDACKNLGN
ncbi:hypothetical protein [Streptomyces bluensis]|uniref:Uncharacterized protein n=1 Tax=Streptomyces bluensis TaxID=33897 RepID=A0ABW6UU65_9ACTN